MRARGHLRRGPRRRAAGFVLGSILLALLDSTQSRAEEWAIVVHANRKEAMTLAGVAQIYLKQRRFWSDGSLIVPVNRNAGSVAREAFAHAVFLADAESHAGYWSRQYFHGILPPLTLASSEAVLRFVATEPRAIGYVPVRLVDGSVQIIARFQGGSD